MSWPTSWTPVGVAPIPSLPGGSETVVSIPWNTPMTTGHFCMLARVNSTEDPVGTGMDTVAPADLPQNNNSITMRNMEVVAFPEITQCSQITTDLYTDVVHLDVVNTTGEPVMVDVILESEGYPLDTGELLVDPGELWDTWILLENFQILGMELSATGFPAVIQGIPLDPYQSIPVTITMTAEMGIRFALRITEQVESQVIGGVTYVREVPYCVYLPLILKAYPPAPAAALDRIWDGWAGWRPGQHQYPWLEVYQSEKYFPLFRPGG
jgi:hypothetical protein